MRWRLKGFDLDAGIGIAEGYATLGRVGFEGRFDYRATGTVVNLAARLCSQGAWRPDPPLTARLCDGDRHRRAPNRSAHSSSRDSTTAYRPTT